jgi:hypothetical protein
MCPTREPTCESATGTLTMMSLRIAVVCPALAAEILSKVPSSSAIQPITLFSPVLSRREGTLPDYPR